ncbi:MAG: GMC family oxidoreductase [candidate division KSB1 bacterium]|nr:GMC family oxidoreductase [candidate division KSB1 bacterium]
MSFDFDYAVIGSGFGGSVAALRLAEKGYSVCVLEQGKRWRDHDYPTTNWHLHKWLWAPRIGCYGIQRLSFFRNALLLTGTGVGGGSLVYCAVLLQPPDSFYHDPQWADMDGDWKSTLAPFFQTAEMMLGVADNPRLGPADELLREYAEQIGREAFFRPTRVGIFFGDPERETPDPYFGGRGPARKGCDFSGRCMVGCRQGGKNSLDRNYLYLAEQLGAEIRPEICVTAIRPHLDGYLIESHRSTGIIRRSLPPLFVRGVVTAAGALGTLKLLMNCKAKGYLPNLSNVLGKSVRTNSEVLVGVLARDTKTDYSKGIAITSSLLVNETTHIEPVRYPAGSNAMFWLGTLMIDGGRRICRPLKYLAAVVTHPLTFFRLLNPVNWAKRAIILLVMQKKDNKMEINFERRWYRLFRRGLTARQKTSSIPVYIPEANAAARAIAAKIGGDPVSSITEVLFNMPLSAHIIGGCVMGRDKDHGVVDKYLCAYGYKNFYIVDGSVLPANLGVNPSLTITALAEYAMSHIPEKSHAD